MRQRSPGRYVLIAYGAVTVALLLATDWQTASPIAAGLAIGWLVGYAHGTDVLLK